MLNLNVTILSQVVDQARTTAAEHPRWLHAIDRAVVELLDNPYIERGELHGIIIMSSTSANLYAANGTCQCEAHRYGQPCWHRAAARLVRLHDEAIDVDRENTHRYGAQVMADHTRAARLAAAEAAAAALNECYS
jgi:hypothetical protein